VGGPTYSPSATGGGSGNPVTFSIDGTSTAGACTINAGVVSFAGAGSCIIDANQLGNANYSAAPTATQTVTVSKGAVTLALASSRNPSSFGQAVTFTVTITAGGAPTGTVTFKDGATTLGSGTLAGGQATFTTSALALGVHMIAASYGGDTNFVAGTSPALSQAVNVPADSIKLRQMQILATQTSAQISGQAISGATGDAIDAGFSDKVQPVTPNGSGFTYNFAADAPIDPRDASARDGVKDFVAAPDRTTNTLMDQEFAALGYARIITKAPPKSPVVQRDWLGWIDVRGLSLNNNNTLGNDLKGNQLNVTAGLTRKLTPDFLVGGFAGYEHLDFNSDALNSRLKGDGWTAGGYLGWRVAQSLRFDMTLARSGIAYNDAAGMAAASFPGDRWLASGGLTGTYHWQALVLQPSAKVYALWEHDGAYTDSLGIAQPTNNFSTGRASAGTKVSYPFEWTSTVALAPYAGVFGDYYFTGNNAAVAGVPTPALLLQGWSARFATGLDMKFRNGGVISVGGELGGIGSNTSSTIWTYKARGSVPF
jgi:outer membrane autotransporter protein